MARRPEVASREKNPGAAGIRRFFPLSKKSKEKISALIVVVVVVVVVVARHLPDAVVVVFLPLQALRSGLTGQDFYKYEIKTLNAGRKAQWYSDLANTLAQRRTAGRFTHMPTDTSVEGALQSTLFERKPARP